MEKEIVLQSVGEEMCASVFENGRLMEFYLERQDGGQLTGNLYKGRVENVLPGMQAAFVDIGLEKNAFLYVDDLAGDPGMVRDVRHMLKSGQEILVQVVKEAVGSKGPRVTGKLSLAGRFVVLLPNSRDVGISRKITDEAARERVKAFAEDIVEKHGHGVIVRTCAGDASPEQLEADYQRLLLLWEDIAARFAKTKAPALLHQEESLPERILRDIWSEDVEQVVVDSEAAYHSLWQTFRRGGGRTRLRLLPDEKIELLYNIRAEVHKALKRRIWLKNGGYLVIDQTEALAVIDVNTGKFVGTNNDLQQTIVQMNLEACEEIARQIRLRNLGGIIIVDFIDMQDAQAKEQLVAELGARLSGDRIRTRVLGITGLGLVEINRKKSRMPLAALLERPCPCCDGKGRVLSEETVAARIRRELVEMAQRTEAEAIAVTCHPLVAACLIGENSQRLAALQQTLGKELIIAGRSDQLPERYQLQAVHGPTADRPQAAPVLPGEIIRLAVSDVHDERRQNGIGRREGFVIEVAGAGRDVGQELVVEIERVFATYAQAKKLSQRS